jgi:hypothetical protein
MSVNKTALDKTASKLHVSISDAHVIIATYLELVGFSATGEVFAFHRGGGNYIVGEKLRGKGNIKAQYGDTVTFED